MFMIINVKKILDMFIGVIMEENIINIGKIRFVIVKRYIYFVINWLIFFIFFILIED